MTLLLQEILAQEGKLKILYCFTCFLNIDLSKNSLFFNSLLIWDHQTAVHSSSCLLNPHISVFPNLKLPCHNRNSTPIRPSALKDL